MKFYVLTLFPDLIRTAVETSITGRAIREGVFSVETVNIRDFATHTTMRVDDYPYGGGAGMVMEAEPVYQAVQSVEQKAGHRPRVVYLTPQAKVLDQTMVETLAREEELVLLCGHYEGIDERVLEEVVTDYVSIGDYVLTGGELAAAVLIDAVSRFLPGVLHNEESSRFESLQDNLLEYPQYTRPEVWHDRAVPKVLLSGDHGKIEAWRYEQSVARTAERRPDLLDSSLQVSCIWYGTEQTEAYAEQFCEAMSRYGKVYDYNRKKLQKQRRQCGENDFLCLFMPAEMEVELPFAERFRNLQGLRTKLALFYAARNPYQETIRAWLTENGFRVIHEEVLPEVAEANWAQNAALQLRRQLFS